MSIKRIMIPTLLIFLFFISYVQDGDDKNLVYNIISYSVTISVFLNLVFIIFSKLKAFILKKLMVKWITILRDIVNL